VLKKFKSVGRLILLKHKATCIHIQNFDWCTILAVVELWLSSGRWFYKFRRSVLQLKSLSKKKALYQYVVAIE